MNGLYRDETIALRAENDALRAQVRDLEQKLAPPPKAVPVPKASVPLVTRQDALIGAIGSLALRLLLLPSMVFVAFLWMFGALFGFRLVPVDDFACWWGWHDRSAGHGYGPCARCKKE